MFDFIEISANLLTVKYVKQLYYISQINGYNVSICLTINLCQTFNR